MAKTVLSIRIDELALQKLDLAAGKLRWSRSKLVEHIVESYLQTTFDALSQPDKHPDTKGGGDDVP